MLFYMILGLFMGDGNYRENWDLFLMIKSKQKRFLLFTVYYTAIKFKEGYFHDFYGIVYMHFFLCIILIYIFFSLQSDLTAVVSPEDIQHIVSGQSQKREQGIQR